MNGLQYLKDHELLPFIPVDHQQELDTMDKRRIEMCERYAISDVREYLMARYNIDADLEKTNDDRPDYLIKIIAKLTTCYLYKHTLVYEEPVWLQQLSMSAYGSLKKVGTGGAEGLLSPLEPYDDGTDPQVRPMSSQKERRPKFA